MIDRNETQWYRDAVIYQLHVKSFFDSSNDGVGDFIGVTQNSITSRSSAPPRSGDAVLSLALAG